MENEKIEHLVEIEDKLKILSYQYYLLNKFKTSLTLQAQKLGKNETHEQIMMLISEAAKLVRKNIKRLINQHPVYTDYLRYINGIGEITAAFLLGIIPARKFATLNKLYKYSGLAPPEAYSGGRKYNHKIRWALFNICNGFIKQKNVYYTHYTKYRTMLEEWYPNSPKGAKHFGAMRITLKLFLSHYYEMYRRILGMPVPPPYFYYAGKKQTYMTPITDKPCVAVQRVKEYYAKCVQENNMDAYWKVIEL